MVPPLHPAAESSSHSAAATLPDDLITPIDRYLAAQQSTSAVERFAARHDADLLEPDSRWYSDRLPASPPGVGQQYAFQVDLDRCSGCKSCVAACHSLNGLDVGESWRAVGELTGEFAGRAQTQNVPTGCHHCLDPACLSGCPTNAYEKDPYTGIVKHLDDQCFGCGYCELTCPYEVPKLNTRLGIVRKCDMCSDRLAEGEAPACVQACPTSTITITIVDTEAVAASTTQGALVPGAPESAITQPTTQYIGTRTRSLDLEAADHHALHLSHAHPPLAFMLVLTQLSVGAFVATLIAERFGNGLPVGGSLAAATAAVVALAASLLHLGRPLVAYRAVLGLRHSWLSREIVAFSAYAVLAALFAIGIAIGDAPRFAIVAVGTSAALAGVVGITCSALIYVITRRAWWQARFTLTKFGLTAASTGPLLVAAVVMITGVGDAGDLAAVVRPLLVVSAVATFVAIADELWFIRPGRWEPDSDLDRTSRLLRRRLTTSTAWRFVLAAIGGIVVPIALLGTVQPTGDAHVAGGVVAGVALVGLTTGSLIERYQFFVASVTPRMPGGFRR